MPHVAHDTCTPGSSKSFISLCLCQALAYQTNICVCGGREAERERRREMDAHVDAGMYACAYGTGPEEDTRCPAPSLFASFPGDPKLGQQAPMILLSPTAPSLRSYHYRHAHNHKPLFTRVLRIWTQVFELAQQERSPTKPSPQPHTSCLLLRMTGF